MTYLYGDSTESNLSCNYLELLRMALDACVDLVRAEGALLAVRQRRRTAERDAGEELAHIEKLGAGVGRLLEEDLHDTGESPVGRMAATIAEATTEARRRAAEAIRARLAEELSRLAGNEEECGRACLRAVEPLLLAFDLPDGANEIRLVATADAPYQAHLHQRTGHGMEALIALAVPADSPLHRPVRVNRFAEGLELHGPDEAGWLRKSTRVVAQRVDRLFLAEVSSSPERTRLVLRSTPGAEGAGVDIDLASDSARDELVFVRADGTRTICELVDADRAALWLLVDRVREQLNELGSRRAELVDLRVDGSSLAELANPSSFAARLVSIMAPVVREIAAHSVSRDELVLRRTVGQHRREEIFVPVRELRERIAVLAPAQRAIFAPLGLAEAGDAPARELEADEPTAFEAASRALTRGATTAGRDLDAALDAALGGGDDEDDEEEDRARRSASVSGEIELDPEELPSSAVTSEIELGQILDESPCLPADLALDAAEEKAAAAGAD